MKGKAADYLILDEISGTYHENPEQVVRDDVEKHYWLHVGRTILKDWRLYVMLIPTILVFLFWRYLPMYELLGSFKVSDEVKPVSQQFFAGFSYFKTLLVGGTGLSTEFWRALRNTFLLSFYGLCFGFPMPIILALFFNEVRSNIARSVYQVLTYLPKFMSTVVMTSLVTMLVKQGSDIRGIGIVSQFLVKIGLLSQEVADAGLLNNPSFFRAIYQISGIWGSGLRQHRVLRRHHRHLAHQLRGRPDRRRQQDGSDALCGAAQHPFHHRHHANHPHRFLAEHRL